MANQSFSASPEAKRDAMRAGMLSASFERWRREYHPYPLHLPTQLQPVQPLGVQRVTPLVVRAPDNRRTLGSVCRCMDSDLHDSPGLDRFRVDAQQAYDTNEYSDEKDFDTDTLIDDSERDQSHTEIEFDPDTLVTTVTASSFFPNVSYSAAKQIIEAADPPNWAKALEGTEAVPRFFLESIPGTWNPEAGTFDPQNISVGSYQLRERVEWNWSPQVIGGTINILHIENKDAIKSVPVASAFAASQNARASSELLKEVIEKKTLALPRHLLEPSVSSPEQAPYSAPEQATTFRHYEYRLIRCVQSKFLASWQSGGLDVDQGYYKATWVPEQPGIGTLVIQAKKSVHYSRRADVVPGLASMLNVMAPAIISLLMRNLGYRGVRDGLKAGFSSIPPATAQAI